MNTWQIEGKGEDSAQVTISKGASVLSPLLLFTPLIDKDNTVFNT